jgi:hypothetical protein
MMGPALLGLSAPVAAQQLSSSAPQAAGAAAQDESGKAGDRGGLSSRGGQALQSQRTFQETIGSRIFTPIGTSMYTPVQQPPDSAPRS